MYWERDSAGEILLLVGPSVALGQMYGKKRFSKRLPSGRTYLCISIATRKIQQNACFLGFHDVQKPRYVTGM
jgi:hypothetical protein